MGRFFRSNKWIFMLAGVFIFALIMFNIYDITVDKTEKFAYTADEIEALDIELININTADLNTLCELSGVSESTAQKIIDYREENGDFLSIEEIMEVKGIGEKTFLKIKSQITI